MNISITKDAIILGISFGFRRLRYTWDDIEAIHRMRKRNQIKSYAGLMIRFRDGQQFHITAMEFANYHQLYDAIVSRTSRYEKLYLRIWTPFMIAYGLIGLLILIAMIALKFCDLYSREL